MKADLHFGDNLEWLSRLPDSIVDLCYIDPPFNSQANYNIPIGGAQVQAFGDTWSWGIEDARMYKTLLERGNHISMWAEGMMKAIGTCGMFSYLIYMAERLIEIKRVLKDTGSIYVHCDHSADFHLRLLLDAIFVPDNWRNSIVWSYKYGGRSKSSFGNKHDTILFYSKSNKYIFNNDAVKIPHEEASLEANFRYVDDDGRRYRKGTWKSGKEYRYYADEGRTCDDVWTDLGSLHQADKERVDYPTQKPLALLERIILASSNPNDIVMDCFMGSGTTAVAAVKNGRNFMGCDITFLAVDIAMDRLKVMEAPPEISLTGHPETIDDAHKLAEQDKFQFQAWALDMVGCNPSTDRTSKRGKDSGIDGKQIVILNDSSYTTIISVKGGKPKLTDLRDLIGTVTKENAQRGVLLMLDEPTKDMVTTAAAVGIGDYGETKCVVLSAQDLLDGKKIPEIKEI